jgi:hypothetical protein
MITAEHLVSMKLGLESLTKRSAVGPVLVGAGLGTGVGAGIGAASASKKERLRGALKGALYGGAGGAAMGIPIALREYGSRRFGAELARSLGKSLRSRPMPRIKVKSKKEIKEAIMRDSKKRRA